jgi:Avidin family
MKRVLLALVVLFGFQSIAAAQGLPAWSLWQNQRGSTLEVFMVDSSGSFQGQFINQANGYDCKGIPYPAVGTSTAVAVVFSVTFVKCTSNATWYGVVTGNTMRTNWVLLYAPPNGPPQKSQGTDIFTRVR